MNASFEELEAINGIGSVTAKSIIDFFSDKNNRGLVQELFNSGVVIQEEKSKTEIHNTFFSGKKIVITGELESFTRKEIKEILENMGADVTDSVSSKTDLLIAGKNTGKKFTDAKKLGVQIIDENKFLELLEEKTPGYDIKPGQEELF